MRHSLVKRAVPALIAVATLGVSTDAGASVTLGQTSGAIDDCGGNQVLVQTSVGAAPAYQASSSGVVVSWSYLAHAGNPNIRFKVYHATTDPAKFFVRSASAERNPGSGANQVHPNQLNTFAES